MNGIQERHINYKDMKLEEMKANLDLTEKLTSNQKN